MITEFDTETATLIVPVGEKEFGNDTMAILNRRYGGNVIFIEVDYFTENFTKIDLDYSSMDCATLDDAKNLLAGEKGHYAGIVGDIVDYLGCECNHSYKDAWHKESMAYIIKSHKEALEHYEEWLEEITTEGPDTMCMRFNKLVPKYPNYDNQVQGLGDKIIAKKHTLSLLEVA
jgi:hypothetical protein